MADILTISKEKPLLKDMDYEFLREEGLKYIEKLGNKLWTDYNIHDPGITILEVLCYAITDLGYRTNFKIEDLLTESDSSSYKSQFFTAKEILTCSPVTENDYRKVLIDVDKVKNAWLELATVVEKDIYIKCKDSLLTLDEQPNKLSLKGLYNVWIELDDEIDPADTDKTDPIIKAVSAKLNSTRNLAEDFLNISIIPVEPIGICVDIEIDAESDVDETKAEIYFRVHQFISPAVNIYTLEEMLDKEKKSEEIFEGPVLDNGFIDDDELEKSVLPQEIHVSDLYQIIMNIEEVKAVKRLILTKYDSTGNPASEGQPWLLKLTPGHKPLLSLEKSVVNFYKGILPFVGDEEKVKEKFELLKLLAEKTGLEKINDDLKLSEGTYKDIKDYTSIQEEFPITYGIGSYGLPDTVSEKRKAQAKQLKGYLLFYDQLLANYLAQLSHVRDLLSVSYAEDSTYFTQALYQTPGIKDLLVESESEDWEDTKSDYAENLQKFAESETTRIDRRHRFLNHLIARFGEKFTDYTLLMHTLYGSKADEDIIEDKKTFLTNYPNISYNRGKAFNYRALVENVPDVWDTNNISGLEARISTLLGIENSTRRSLACDPAYQVEVSTITETEHIVEVKDEESTVVLTSSVKYSSEGEAGTAANEIDNLLLTKECLKLEETASEKFVVNVYNNTSVKLAESTDFEEYSEALAHLNKIMELACPEKSCENEGFHLIEHVLLRPKDTGYNLLPIQAKCNDCKEEFDPYSFRLTVVIPYWPQRFQKREFRTFFEETLRKETPAHLGVKICWISCYQMREFESAYKNWLTENAKPQEDQNTDLLRDYNNQLISVLIKLRNVYPEAELFDCKESDNPVILGYTSLGQF